MLLQTLHVPVRALSCSSKVAEVHARATQAGFGYSCWCNPHRNSPILNFVRYATHQAEGRANGPKDGAGKRLGAKKGAEEYVVPGNIIFRQRGTHWFPGDNCDMGRDHTIFAKQAGYVKFYRDPLKHPKRKYIGVVFERHQTLPQPPNAPRRRRLNMLAYRMETPPVVGVADGVGEGNVVAADLIAGTGESASTIPQVSKREREKLPQQRGKGLVMRPGYMYRAANWEIGRAAERAGIKVKERRRKDRFAEGRKTRAGARLLKKTEKRRTAGKKKRKR